MPLARGVVQPDPTMGVPFLVWVEDEEEDEDEVGTERSGVVVLTCSLGARSMTQLGGLRRSYRVCPVSSCCSRAYFVYLLFLSASSCWLIVRWGLSARMLRQRRSRTV